MVALRRAGFGRLFCSLAIAFWLVAASACAPAERATQRGNLPALRVSEDGHRLVNADGDVFFWLGDTAWELFHRLNTDEADVYLRDRASKGFNVIQAVALAELDGLTVPNASGALPLIGQDPSTPNEAYFVHVDSIVRRANTLGMYVGLLPTWGDKWNLKWGVGPEVFTPENAKAFGRFLGKRYSGAGVIWILGGDRNPEEDEDYAITRALASGIEEGTGRAALITYHPQGGSSSADFFNEDAWLDMHLFQSGHGRRDFPNYETTGAAYRLSPARPVVDGEPRYEDHPVNWKPEEDWFDAFDVRQAAYWSVLAGAAGHTYGNHNVWQMLDDGRAPISWARSTWKGALDHPGARQMSFLRRLFEARPFLTLMPNQSIIAAENPEDAGHIQAAQDADGTYAIVYTPYGRDVNLHLTLIGGRPSAAWWFDPRRGRSLPAAGSSEGGVITYDPPGLPGRGNDWVLVLDGPTSSYGRPEVSTAGP